MSKAFCPANCGRKFINEDAAIKHADMYHHDWRTPRRRGWATPYGFGDFTHPVTYEEACEQMVLLLEKAKPLFIKNAEIKALSESKVEK